MTTYLTPERHSFAWFLIRDNADSISNEDPPVIDAVRQPIPSVGHVIYHEPMDETFNVTRVLWEVREGYPLIVKVFGKVMLDGRESS